VIIGETFAWAHLPKAGGSATTELFRLFPELIVFGDFEDTNAKHTPFRERAAKVNGKTLSLNIRRLPFWVLSRAQHAAHLGVWPEYKPIPMGTSEELSESSFPDSRIAIFTDRGRFEIDQWLRMEQLADDFLAFISRFTEVTDEQRERVLSLPPVNTHEYDHEIASWFTDEQVERMYERNPVWASLERAVYGDLYAIGPARGIIER
jgi:hypothetical protein